MIGLECCFSALSFMARRIVLQNLFLKRAKSETSYLVRILLYGEVQLILEQLKLDSLILKTSLKL